MLLIEAAHRYVNESGRVNTAQSRKQYINKLRRLQHLHPDKQLDQFTADDLAAYCVMPDGERPVASATVGQRRSMVKALFGWATWKGFVAVDPTAGIEWAVRPGRGNVRSGNWLNDHQVAGILNSYNQFDLVEARDRMLLNIGLHTGLRCSEIAVLHWGQVSADRTGIVVAGKGRKVVEQPVPDELAAELNSWRRRTQGTAVLPSFQSVWRDEGRVIEPRWDAPLEHNGIYRAVRAAGAKIGLDSLAPHDMRRSYAGWLDSQGLDLQTIRDLMRHESIEMTARYLAKNPNRGKRAIAGLRRAV